MVKANLKEKIDKWRKGELEPREYPTSTSQDNTRQVSHVKIKAEPAQLNILLQTYQGALEPIKRELKSKIEYYSKFSNQEALEKVGWVNGEKREWLECIKDFIILIQEDYINPELLDKENYKKLLIEAYDLVIGLLKRYLDWSEDKYNLTTLWIMGTYNYYDFPTFPYLFLNAMRASGKSRALNLITSLSWEGRVLNSLTEATMFRTKGTLGIDEFEGIERKGMESLRELLNSAYKKGTTVVRMKKVKTLTGEEQVAEEFEVYRPIVMANISGMETVLGDRCISMVIEKSSNKKFTNLIEIFKHEDDFKKAKDLLNQCRLCRCRYAGEYIEMYKRWNNTNYTNNTNDTNNTNSTEEILIKTLKSSTLTGRDLELSLPLCILSADISPKLLYETTLTLQELFSEKKGEDLVENTDISLIDFVSQEPEDSENFYHSVTGLLDNFKKFSGINEEWLNTKWMGKALKRLSLIKDKRRLGKGREIQLNIKHAQEKIKIFK